MASWNLVPLEITYQVLGWTAETRNLGDMRAGLASISVYDPLDENKNSLSTCSAPDFNSLIFDIFI
jgi:hypothetical protein